jgi:hypothetical protein
MILPLGNVLFHGSSIQNVERILESDRLLPTTRLIGSLAAGLSPKLLQRFPECRVASLSRSISVARAHSSGIGRIQAAVIALDAEAVKRKLGGRLIPCNDIFLRTGEARRKVSECEEAVLGGVRPVRSLLRYVIVFKLGQRSIDDLLTDFPSIGHHPGLIVVRDRRRTEWDHSADRTFERFMNLGALRKQLAGLSVSRHRAFRPGPKKISLLKQLAINEPAIWSRKYPEPIGARTSRGGGSSKWRPAV